MKTFVLALVAGYSNAAKLKEDYGEYYDPYYNDDLGLFEDFGDGSDFSYTNYYEDFDDNYYDFSSLHEGYAPPPMNYYDDPEMAYESPPPHPHSHPHPHDEH